MKKSKIILILQKWLNGILGLIDLRIEQKTRFDFQTTQLNAAENLIRAVATPKLVQAAHNLECIVFSMDRAMQLHALLGSYQENVANAVPVHLLYRTSSESHERAYREVFAEYSSTLKTIITQTDTSTFRRQLMQILKKIDCQKIVFLVDDDLFIEKCDFQMIASFDSSFSILSLRMGSNLTESYTMRSKQSLPPFVRRPEGVQLLHNSIIPKDMVFGEEFLYWIWSEGVIDWAYPLSVDGHIFNREEIITLAETIEFNSPNTFENNLQRYLPYFTHRLGICFGKSRLMNIPCNKVQTDNDNIHGKIHQEDLLSKWHQGLSIDYRRLFGLNNVSTHQEIAFSFIGRKRAS